MITKPAAEVWSSSNCSKANSKSNCSWSSRNNSSSRQSCRANSQTTLIGSLTDFSTSRRRLSGESTCLRLCKYFFSFLFLSLFGPKREIKQSFVIVYLTLIANFFFLVFSLGFWKFWNWILFRKFFFSFLPLTESWFGWCLDVRFAIGQSQSQQRKKRWWSANPQPP